MALAAERKAETEKDKAQAVNDFLTRKLLAQADPENNPVDSKVTVMEVLDRAAAATRSRASRRSRRPSSTRSPRPITGWESKARQEPFRRAVDLLSRALGPEHPETLRVINRLVSLLWNTIQRKEAEALIRRNLEACRRVLGPEHPETLRRDP